MSETPTPPSTPGNPSTPGTPAAPAVKDSGEYFNSSRLKIIGMITAATVAVGALGGIAGVAFDPDPVDKDNVIQPGGDGTQLAPQGAGSMGNSAPHGRADAISRALPGADATSTPSPVGSASPGSDDEGTEDSDTPAPSDDGADGKATIPATGVDVFVPDGWHVDFTDDNRVFQSDDQNNFSFAFSYVEDPSVAAGDVLTQNIESLLPGENYTQLQVSDVVTLDPFGSVVSLAGIEYEALWVDNQGSISVHGQIYVGIRQDGTVLGILLEHAPAEDFEAAFEDMVPILDNSYGRFAGLA